MPKTKLTFNLNGSSQTIEVDQDMPLLWAIRDIVGITGTKFGCGKGLCGACTVHLNGQAVRSCSIPAIAVEGQSVTTIEGLANGEPHPLQKKWVELGVPQCGYCQPGQIMQAAALLSGSERPSPQQIKETMSGNLCRCGTYQRIQEAISQVAAEQAEKGAVS